MSGKIAGDLVGLKRDEVLSEVQERIGKDDPLALLKECQEGMDEVGRLFEKGEYYLAELILSAEIFKEVTKILNPHLNQSSGGSEPLGKVVLATLQGDIHDIGKNIFAVLLQARGFEVFDLGVDVPPMTVVEKVKEVRPDFVGFSALITSCFEAMKETVEALEKEGLRKELKLMVGGGVTNDSTRDYLGADFQTIDAAAGVNYCLQNVKGVA